MDAIIPRRQHRTVRIVVFGGDQIIIGAGRRTGIDPRTQGIIGPPADGRMEFQAGIEDIHARRHNAFALGIGHIIEGEISLETGIGYLINA